MTYIVGHRGAAGLEPENTIKGFQKALEIGVDYVECDVHLSLDGYPVVIHDATLDRTTSGKGKVEDYTLDELKKLDTGKGEKIPVLEEVMELVRGKAGLIVEIKQPEARDVIVKKVKEGSLEGDVLLASFDARVLKDVPAEIGRALLSYRDPLLSFYIAREISAAFLGLKYTLINQKVVDKAKKEGIKLLAWTVNEEEDISKMIDLNVDAIASD
ncbi:MAG: glycerophosphodiester phosphodiesterase, partial [Caldiserica bacterium]|nr:glycerophosphodiester phosphodiesterase [Caldisericota bacterium]